jgi:hypothetical protein
MPRSDRDPSDRAGPSLPQPVQPRRISDGLLQCRFRQDPASTGHSIDCFDPPWLTEQCSRKDLAFVERSVFGHSLTPIGSYEIRIDWDGVSDYYKRLLRRILRLISMPFHNDFVPEQ